MAMFGNGDPIDTGGEYKVIEDNGPKIRLLYCYECKTIEELPDFEGHPDDDVLLQLTIERHGPEWNRHHGFLSKIPAGIYRDHKKEVVKNLRDKVGGGLADIDPDYYNTKATFFEDAMKCYNLHLRPTGRCPDWAADNKKLVPKTKAERKELGLDLKPSTNIYLCDFCPAKEYMVHKKRLATGLYE